MAKAHHSLVALLRCEIQAIEQHWSLHRLAVSLPDGEPDVDLARNLELLGITGGGADWATWPAPEPAAWQRHLQRALEQDLEADLAQIRQRQERYLRRELDRVDDYFENHARELAERVGRSRSAESKAKLTERQAAVHAEHDRRRRDQVQRHEIRIVAHVDALLLIAEPAWGLSLLMAEHGERHRQAALWVPRTRRWSLVK